LGDDRDIGVASVLAPRGGKGVKIPARIVPLRISTNWTWKCPL